MVAAPEMITILHAIVFRYSDTLSTWYLRILLPFYEQQCLSLEILWPNSGKVRLRHSRKYLSGRAKTVREIAGRPLTQAAGRLLTDKTSAILYGAERCEAIAAAFEPALS